MTGARARILVVEDERKVANAIREGLESEGYEVFVAHTGDDALAQSEKQAFDIVVLDLMLPGRNGWDVLATLRERGSQTRVLVLTASDALEDRVRGLNAGADDYLIKPFAFAEVLARIRAVLRRGRTTDGRPLIVADLQMDPAGRQVTRAGKAVDLTTREFDLLHYLLAHEGQVVSREALVHEVWKETMRSTTLDNVIDVHIARLRRKIDFEGAVKLIHTVRGVGFIVREGEP
jgi:DNA-binding response OmpR family regulator